MNPFDNFSLIYLFNLALSENLLLLVKNFILMKFNFILSFTIMNFVDSKNIFLVFLNIY